MPRHLVRNYIFLSVLPEQQQLLAEHDEITTSQNMMRCHTMTLQHHMTWRYDMTRHDDITLYTDMTWHKDLTLPGRYDKLCMVMIWQHDMEWQNIMTRRDMIMGDTTLHGDILWRYWNNMTWSVPWHTDSIWPDDMAWHAMIQCQHHDCICEKPVK